VSWTQRLSIVSVAGLGMRSLVVCLLLTGACLMHATARAQIYTCTAEDGTRVFSDERCGPDAKVVPGVTSKKRPAASAASASRVRKVAKPPAELEQLSSRCNAGDMKACKEWTLGGGPDLLKEKERKAELDCEAGSLAACEERYCRDGVDPDCRARVLRTARLAGENWYLREEERGRSDGRTRYRVRCVPQGASARDITIECAPYASPDRCSIAQQRFARLDQAAAQSCSTGK
jgi:Domain of unknown function (DUF4124)